jgi:hypothetical protein
MGNRSSVGGKREYVDSEALLWVRYDPKQRTLEVEFPRHTIYQYLEVPEFRYRGLMEAESMGAYFNAFIRDCYETVRIR